MQVAQYYQFFIIPKLKFLTDETWYDKYFLITMANQLFYQTDRSPIPKCFNKFPLGSISLQQVMEVKMTVFFVILLYRGHFSKNFHLLFLFVK